MRVLLHICCAPCATVPVEELTKEGFQVDGFFYNPNIHPYIEYRNRLEAVEKFSEKAGLKTIYHDEYDLKMFLREIAFREDARCRFCYYMRFKRTAIVAKNGNYDFFTSTLLISPHQSHELIESVARAIESEVGVKLLYRDFRDKFKRSVEISKEYGLYRQQYCGCIYSEYERYSSQKKSGARPEAT